MVEHVQGEEEDLKSVVASLRDTYGVDYVYCWHGLPAYWSGVSVEDPGEGDIRAAVLAGMCCTTIKPGRHTSYLLAHLRSRDLAINLPRSSAS